MIFIDLALQASAGFPSLLKFRITTELRNAITAHL